MTALSEKKFWRKRDDAQTESDQLRIINDKLTQQIETLDAFSDMLEKQSKPCEQITDDTNQNYKESIKIPPCVKLVKYCYRCLMYVFQIIQ